MIIFFKIILLLLGVIGLQCLVRLVIFYFDRKMRTTDKRIRDFLKNGDKNGEIDERYNFEEFYIESTGIFLLSEKKKSLKFITTIIGILEVLIFGFIAFLSTKNGDGICKSFSTLFTFSIAWIALKIFGNYQQWAGAVFGRTNFYIFLLGSVLNIFGAIFIGFLASLILV